MTRRMKIPVEEDAKEQRPGDKERRRTKDQKTMRSADQHSVGSRDLEARRSRFPIPVTERPEYHAPFYGIK